MSLPRFAVQHPVFASMVALMVVVLGVVSMNRLRIDLLPAIEVPNLSVSTSYEGADPEVVERQVTQIVEEIVATVPGVTEISSNSTEGRSNVRVTFAWGTNLDIAATDVRARLEEEQSELPDDVERPQIRKFDIASFPVVLLGVSSKSLDPVELTEIVERDIRERFTRIDGVAQVDLWGGYNRELRIAFDPDQVRSLGLSLNEVISALRDANIDLPAGSLERGRLETVLRAPAEFSTIAEIAALVIAQRNGMSITLDQVAKLDDTFERLTRVIRVNGDDGIRVAIRKASDANTVAVARAVLAEIEHSNEALPQLQITPIINQGGFIERSIANVINSILLGGVLAVLILLFFLRSLRSTLVIALSIPLSILATMAMLYGAGLTINLMTLGGLALGVGMMVDSSIVVLENIYRRRSEQGEGPISAAVNGSNEVASAIVASTITTLVIFLPLVFIQGVSGLLFVELALVVVLSLVASLIVSLSLVPMLAARLISGEEHSASQSPRQHWWSGLARFAESSQKSLEQMYHGVLQRSLRRPLLTITAAFLLFAASLLLWPSIGSEFMPPSDEGEVRITAEFEPGTRLDIADRQARIIEAIVAAEVPEAISWVTSVNSSGRRGNAATEVSVNLNVGPAQQRSRDNTAIAADVRKALDGNVPGATIRTRAPQGQFLLQRVLRAGDSLTVEVRGFDLDILKEIAQQVNATVATIPGVTEVEDDLAEGIPQQLFTIDRAKIADLGLRVRDVAEMLETAVGGRVAGDYRPQGLSIPMRVQLADVQAMSLDELLAQQLRTPSGALVALENVVSIRPGVGPAEINRVEQRRVVTLALTVEGRDTGSVAVDIQTALRSIPLPDGYAVSIGGSYAEQQKSAQELLLSFALALVLVYMVLASQYESLRDPLVVMFSVPVAAIGVLIALYITRSTMNLQSGIGCIMLGGIVVNNAILLVDQAGRLRREGMLTLAALSEAGRRRLRPILMTTATTVLGLLPLALGIGEGADAQAPLARAVVGGLIASTLITLVLVPAIYALLHRDPPQAA